METKIDKPSIVKIRTQHLHRGRTENILTEHQFFFFLDFRPSTTKRKKKHNNVDDGLRRALSTYRYVCTVRKERNGLCSTMTDLFFCDRQAEVEHNITPT